MDARYQHELARAVRVAAVHASEASKIAADVAWAAVQAAVKARSAAIIAERHSTWMEVLAASAEAAALAADAAAAESSTVRSRSRSRNRGPPEIEEE
jgi:hypothetical protein